MTWCRFIYTNIMAVLIAHAASFYPAHAEQVKVTATAAAKAAAPTLETTVLKPAVGAEDKKLGVKVSSVNADGSGLKVIVSVPEPIANGDLEEVVVLGRRPAKDSPRPEQPQLKRFEVINDLEAGRSGVVVYLQNNEDFVLRFNYSDQTSEQLKTLLGN